MGIPETLVRWEFRYPSCVRATQTAKISNFNIPRGRVAIAIFEHESVIAVEVNMDTNLCNINKNMPTNKSDSEYG